MCLPTVLFFSLWFSPVFHFYFFLPSHQNTWCMFFKFFIMTAHRRSYIKGQNPGAGSFCCSFSPGWTPLPLLPKGSFYGVGVACWHHTPVSSAGEGGGRKSRSGGREELRTHGGPRQLFSDSLFCNCPGGPLSSAEFQKSYETGPELDVQRLTHSDTVLLRGRGSPRTLLQGRGVAEAWISQQSSRR